MHAERHVTRPNENAARALRQLKGRVSRTLMVCRWRRLAMDTVHAHTGRPRVSRSDHPSRPRKDQAAQTVMTLPHEEYKKVLSAIPIVCVDCLVVNENEEYLLVKRANPPLKGEYWVPGGRLYKTPLQE